MKMRLPLIATFLSVLPCLAWGQSQQSKPPPLLTKEDCQLISRRGPDTIYIEGPIQFGVVSIAKTLIERNAPSLEYNGFTLWEAIEATCFRNPI